MGGGPLTTLVLGDGKLDTLWHIVWLNLIEKAKFLDLCDGAKTSPSDQFPWLARTKPKTTAMDIHPAQLFWAMPRRIRLNFDDLSSGVCTVCSRQSDLLISRYREKNKGTEYVAPVKHPLSPYDARKGKAVLGKRGGVHYRHWLGLVISDPGVGIEPAAVVHEFIEGGRLQHDCQFRIWAFGYDMDNMKARGWHEARMPLIEAAPHVKGEYEPHVFSMVKAADQVAKNLRDAVKRAWFRRPGDVKQGVAFLDRAFWQNTEHAFYGSLHSLKTALESGGSVLSAAEEWLSSLCGGALALFDVHAWNGPIEDADPKRVVIARNDMDKFNRGKKIKEMLGLPVQKQSKARTDKRKGPAD